MGTHWGLLRLLTIDDIVIIKQTKNHTIPPLAHSHKLNKHKSQHNVHQHKYQPLLNIYNVIDGAHHQHSSTSSIVTNIHQV